MNDMEDTVEISGEGAAKAAEASEENEAVTQEDATSEANTTDEAAELKNELKENERPSAASGC